MEYHQGYSHSWAWEGDDIYLQADSSIDDISYMFDEATPVKSCGDIGFHFNDCDVSRKKSHESREYSSQVKRRRILDFDCASKEISSSFFKFKERINVYDAALPELDVCVQDEFILSTIEDSGQSEAWLAECLNDTVLNISSDDGNVSATSDVQDDAKEVFNITSDSSSDTVPRSVRTTRNIILKGRKSYMKTPSVAPLSVVYPFDYIKPCEVHGDVTLKDINRLIHTPPPSKPKEVEENDIYPTSAFSGKPVIGKTKIPTRGGKGCITIMRTKG
ncbi:hypothetical protein vseg_013473 [Gypsophila vaccaria]